MRQSGKTTRIVNFAVEQLLESNQVIIADHIAFQSLYVYDDKKAKEFANRIGSRIADITYGVNTIEYEILKTEKDMICYLHIKLKKA